MDPIQSTYERKKTRVVTTDTLCSTVKGGDNSPSIDDPPLLVQLSIGLESTYAQCCNQQPSSHVLANNQLPILPTQARVLTKKDQPMGNGGLDNEDRNLIVRVRDVLGGTPSQPSYLVLDILGQGTFGQVFRCQNIRTKEIVAVKVIRNHPSYYKQAIVEVQITAMLNHVYTPESAPHVVRLLNTFEFQNHLCLVFELLSMNIYELISENNFTGFPLEITRGFLEQMLHALIQLEAVGVIHCDLKPENILLVGHDQYFSPAHINHRRHTYNQSNNVHDKTSYQYTTPWIKVVDFGSACLENETVYSYIQSRFYRSPEVLLGIPYTGTIDMWSLGCIAVELFLGLPLFPGVSEHDQIRLIEETLGPLPQHVLRRGRNLLKYYKMTSSFNAISNEFILKTPQEYAEETNTPVQVSKKYFKYSKLTEMIDAYPIEQGASRLERERERVQREAFLHFVTGLLCVDPDTRWTAEEAMRHPFITGQPLLFTAVGEPHANLLVAAAKEEVYYDPYADSMGYNQEEDRCWPPPPPPHLQEQTEMWSSAYLSSSYYNTPPYYPFPPRKLNAKVAPVSGSALPSYDHNPYHGDGVFAAASSKVTPAMSSSSVVPLRSPTYHYYSHSTSNQVDWRYDNTGYGDSKSLSMYPPSTSYQQPMTWSQPLRQQMEPNRQRHHRYRPPKRHAKDNDVNGRPLYSSSTNSLDQPDTCSIQQGVVSDESQQNGQVPHSTRSSHVTPRRHGQRGSKEHQQRHARLRKSPKRSHSKYPHSHLSPQQQQLRPSKYPLAKGRTNRTSEGLNEAPPPPRHVEATVCAVEEQFSAVMTLAVVASAVALPT